jgi:manganese efflux pump family protein
MALAALITWILTAAGGLALLATWLGKGGLRQRPRTTHLPPGLLFAHLVLAVAGLAVWIAYLLARRPVLAWVALIILAVAAFAGFAMLARWLPVHRAYRVPVAAPTAGGGITAPETARVRGDAPPERHFPAVVVGAHGLLAAATLVLVLLTALGAG